MDRGYNEQFNVGDKLILELTTNEIYEGEYSDGAKNRIDLNNVKQHNNRNTLEGIYSFYRNEIASIRTIQAKKTSREVEKRDEEVTNKVDVVKISEDEYYRLKEVAKNYVYLENADTRYFKAVKELLDAETIGVVCLGAKERNAIIRLLVMSTWRQVYIFDLAHLQNRNFYPELKEIFESIYICKVMHKSAIHVDTLYRCYGVYCQNTFDTMLVDLMIQKKETQKCPELERSISECLNHYLNFPLSLLENAVSVPDKKWIERPLSDKRKLYASQLATYLILLKDHMQRTLFKSMYDMIDNIQDLVYEKNDFEFKMYANNNEVTSDIEDLIPNMCIEKKISDSSSSNSINSKIKQNGNPFMMQKVQSSKKPMNMSKKNGF